MRAQGGRGKHIQICLCLAQSFYWFASPRAPRVRLVDLIRILLEIHSNFVQYTTLWHYCILLFQLIFFRKMHKLIRHLA